MFSAAIRSQGLSVGPRRPEAGHEASAHSAEVDGLDHAPKAGHCAGCDAALGVQRSAAGAQAESPRPVGATEDVVELSDAARSRAEEDEAGEVKSKSGGAVPEDELTDEELTEVDELKDRDREVRQHEQAHKAVAGHYGGSIAYDFQSGPDGRRYAVGGEVPIDISKVAGDPQATLAKMQTVRRAALAPADPSSADRSVAARASQVEHEARAELARGDEDATGVASGPKQASETEAEGGAEPESSPDPASRRDVAPDSPADVAPANSRRPRAAPSRGLSAYAGAVRATLAEAPTGRAPFRAVA